MNVTVFPGRLAGRVCAPPSKSEAHRLLICAALADGETTLQNPGASKDIEATVRCLRALGAEITERADGLRVSPLRRIPRGATLNCGESGSTLRFLLPLSALLNRDIALTGGGRLPARPNDALLDALLAHGARCDRRYLPMRLSGGLTGGVYRLPGDVSSQFFSGLLLALPLLEADSALVAVSPLESAAYVDLTLAAMAAFGVRVGGAAGDWRIPGRQRYHTPGTVRVEGDWSAAAFWLAAGALGSDIAIAGLNERSAQGDRAARTLFSPADGASVDVSAVPDLMPALAAVMAAMPGEREITGARRLRLKESDRLQAMAAALAALGVDVAERPDGLCVRGGRPRGGTVDGCNDHRVVMSCAVLATVCTGPVTIRGAEAVDKSYPDFFDDFVRLGGTIHVEHTGT